MNEIEQAFNELLYGSGAWLGLILIITMLVIGGWRNRYLALIFSLVGIFMGIEYLVHVATNSNFMWASMVMFLTSIFLMIRVTKK